MTANEQSRKWANKLYFVACSLSLSLSGFLLFAQITEKTFPFRGEFPFPFFTYNQITISYSFNPFNYWKHRRRGWRVWFELQTFSPNICWHAKKRNDHYLPWTSNRERQQHRTHVENMQKFFKIKKKKGQRSSNIRRRILTLQPRSTFQIQLFRYKRISWNIMK